MRLAPLFILLAACPEKPDDTADTGDTADSGVDTGDSDSGVDTSPPDWDDASTLCGHVSIVDDCGTALPPTVNVWTVASGTTPCWEDTGGGPDWRDVLMADPPVDAGGWFQDDVDAGDYALLATEGGCYGCMTVTVADGTCPVVELEMAWQITADKPNVYLYPTAPTPVNVRIASPDRIVAEDPAYPDDGWRVVAHPDGRLATPEGPRDYLFYERTVDPARFQRDEGYCVPGRQAVAAMEDHLAALGFLPNEIDDFAEAWDADLPRVGWLTVYPQTEGLPALRIDPRPDHVLRAWYLVEEGCHAVRAPAIVPVERTGWHAAEWGVILASDLPREEAIVTGWRP